VVVMPYAVRKASCVPPLSGRKIGRRTDRDPSASFLLQQSVDARLRYLSVPTPASVVEGFVMDPRFDNPRQEDPHAQLERAFIEEYLRLRHHSRETLNRLPDAEAARLLSEASIYASGRLTEMESRAHLVDELHRAPTSSVSEPSRRPVEAATPVIKASPPPRPRAPVARRRPLRWF
jgi:hypothetical protein